MAVLICAAPPLLASKPAVQDSDAIRVNNGQVLRHDKTDFVGSDFIDLRPCIKIDREAIRDLSDRYVFRNLGGRVREVTRVGAHPGDNTPSFFPSVRLQDD